MKNAGGQGQVYGGWRGAQPPTCSRSAGLPSCDEWPTSNPLSITSSCLATSSPGGRTSPMKDAAGLAPGPADAWGQAAGAVKNGAPCVGAVSTHAWRSPPAPPPLAEGVQGRVGLILACPWTTPPDSPFPLLPLFTSLPCAVLLATCIPCVARRNMPKIGLCLPRLRAPECLPHAC